MEETTEMPVGEWVELEVEPGSPAVWPSVDRSRSNALHTPLCCKQKMATKSTWKPRTTVDQT